jgi:hypothetical protein
VILPSSADHTGPRRSRSGERDALTWRRPGLSPGTPKAQAGSSPRPRPDHRWWATLYPRAEPTLGKADSTPRRRVDTGATVARPVVPPRENFRGNGLELGGPAGPGARGGGGLEMHSVSRPRSRHISESFDSCSNWVFASTGYSDRVSCSNGVF